MTEIDIQHLLLEHLPEARIYVKNPLGDGQHFHALIVCDSFIGESLVQRQRKVMSPIKQYLGAEIHALSLKTMTESECLERAHECTRYFT